MLHLNLEYPDELWRYFSCFDTSIIFKVCWQTAWRTKTCIHIRRVRLFTYQLTVWYLQKCSFVFLMYFMIRRLHKNEQNLENRGCVETGCVTSDVRTVLGFVHVTSMTILNAQLWGLTRYNLYKQKCLDWWMKHRWKYWSGTLVIFDSYCVIAKTVGQAGTSDSW